MPDFTVTLYKDDAAEGESDEEVVTIPSTWEICSGCNGDGKTSSHLGSFTSDEMDEQGEDFREDYMSGAYDKQCDECSGSGKVKVPDMDRVEPTLRARIEEKWQDDANYRAECEMERRMGC